MVDLQFKCLSARRTGLGDCKKTSPFPKGQSWTNSKTKHSATKHEPYLTPYSPYLTTECRLRATDVANRPAHRRYKPVDVFCGQLCARPKLIFSPLLMKIIIFFNKIYAFIAWCCRAVRYYYIVNDFFQIQISPSNWLRQKKDIMHRWMVYYLNDIMNVQNMFVLNVYTFL